MFDKIAHVGIAVKNAQSSIALFERLFGKKPDHREHVVDQMVSTALFEIGGSSIELLEATSEDSSIARFIQKRGEGIHHVSFFVDDIEGELRRLKKEGFQLIDEKPRRGADNCLVAFVHPKSANGVLIELSQKQK